MALVVWKTLAGCAVVWVCATAEPVTATASPNVSSSVRTGHPESRLCTEALNSMSGRGGSERCDRCWALLVLSCRPRPPMPGASYAHGRRGSSERRGAAIALAIARKPGSGAARGAETAGRRRMPVMPQPAREQERRSKRKADTLRRVSAAVRSHPAELGFELDRRKNGRSLFANGIQFAWIDAQRLEDGRRDLGSADGGFDGPGIESRIGEQQDHVGVVMRESAMLGLFMVAAGVSYADIRGHDDIGRARILAGIVEVELQRRTIEELSEADSCGSGVRLQESDCGIRVRRVGQPHQGDVVFRGANPAPIGILRWRHGDMQIVGDHRRRRNAVGTRLALVQRWIDGRLAVLGRDHKQRRIIEAALLQFADEGPDRRVHKLELVQQGRAWGSPGIEVPAGYGQAVALRLDQLLAHADGLEVHAEDVGNRFQHTSAEVSLAIDPVEDRIDFQGVIALDIFEAVGPGRVVEGKGIADRGTGFPGRGGDAGKPNDGGVDLGGIEVIE